MNDKIPEEVLLTKGEISHYYSGGFWNIDKMLLAQLAKVLAAGYLSLEEHQRLVEEAKKQTIIEWLMEHKETYWQKHNGEIDLITRASWTSEEWQALKSG